MVCEYQTYEWCTMTWLVDFSKKQMAISRENRARARAIARPPGDSSSGSSNKDGAITDQIWFLFFLIACIFALQDLFVR